MKTNTAIFSLVLLSVIILSGCAQQSQQSRCREVQMSYEEQEPYIVEYTEEGRYTCEDVTSSILSLSVGELRRFEGRNQITYEMDVTIRNTIDAKTKFNLVGECHDSSGNPIAFKQPIESYTHELESYSSAKWLLRSPPEYSNYEGIATMSYPTLNNCKAIALNVEKCYYPNEQKTRTEYRTVTKYRTETKCD